MLTGSLVALVTPMFEDGSLDFASLTKLVEFHAEAGTAGIVAVGTTGESATVDVEEHIAIVRKTVELVRGRMKVIAGTGANSTREAIELARLAKEAGADMTLSVVPYYNKPTQEGIYQHYKAIAEAVAIPTILYNVPGRTVADMSNDTALRLAQLPNIVGLKDATGDIGRAANLVLRAPKHFALYSGDDATSIAFMLLGGHGVISVTANVAPKLMSELCTSALKGDIAAARVANDKLQGLHQHLFIEANPIPAKWAVSKLGLMPDGIRLPLTKLSTAAQVPLREAMRQAGIAI
ncbi:4-hydroxy-tetrahydrodipicolinate synthase [Chitinimonas sp. BJB300]|uniref:4-hydroxy-tetrahydrodipicolinate synthase n=1 Tax=Chitinimonas sp. BJB300 TaxID=1559339 RepID=UPI000C122561|nr:4-hydroxy-tetrahydrodipicolinate synthase [Chitinimonas sp. BJB300]PHV10833.1 4-hydroxy-tetrahydrodipicolinate synthase [Chitinimonas sp. BJB300]TSJ87054.1 4-hydroxy-tetrahydrodipicolinate synthase [Chitinimonas sp. BJB300]